MITRVLPPTEENIALCAAAIRRGELAAFPTETVYALGANACDEAAVKAVYRIKSRAAEKPLIVAVADKSDLSKVAVNIPEKAHKLIDKFMPGALTLLLDKADCISGAVTAGSDSVAVRIPDNEAALKIIRQAGVPVVVPSANTSGNPSPTLASHVRDDLDGKIGYIIDGGASDIGIESTIIDVRVNPPVILRGGGVTAEDIEAVIGEVKFKREPVFANAYSPRAEVVFSAYYDGMKENVCARYDAQIAQGKSPVIICLNGNRTAYGTRRCFAAGEDYAAYAHNLFALLRRADADGYDTVIAEGVQPEGIGSSLINRLIKISGGQIV